VSDWKRDVYARGGGACESVRRQPSRAQKDACIALQGNVCMYCGLSIGSLVMRNGRSVKLRPEWDHVEPYSYLRQNPSTNWALACHVCNGIKSDLRFESLDDMRAFIIRQRERKGYETFAVAVEIATVAAKTVTDREREYLATVTEPQKVQTFNFHPSLRKGRVWHMRQNPDFRVTITKVAEYVAYSVDDGACALPRVMFIRRFSPL
jgi:hypothetical protein